MEEKWKLAFTIVEELHDTQAAEKAANHFKQTIQQGKQPDEIPEFPITNNDSLSSILISSKLVGSRREAKRLFSQGAISIDGTPIYDEALMAKPGAVLRVGKRRWIRLTEK